MAQGTIKKLITGKGFGFISGEGGDVFFHCSEVKEIPFESLKVGQAVEYEIAEGPKGPRATSIKPV